jgi:hypothetical protein
MIDLDVPQSEAARAEAVSLLSYSNNLISSRTGFCTLGLNDRECSALFEFTRLPRNYGREEFWIIISSFVDFSTHAVIPKAAGVVPAPHWTPLQIMSMIFTLNGTWERLNLQIFGGDNDFELRNGKLLRYQLNSSKLRPNTHNLFGKILAEVGAEAASIVFARLQKLCAFLLGTLPRFIL